MKPYLALFRAGANSLHRAAVERLPAQNFDYALSWFGDAEPEAPGAAFVHRQQGAKWPGLEQTLLAHWDRLQHYRYVWLPDDDLLCVPENVSRLFAVCDELQLELAQPALTRDSYFTHVVTLQHSEFQLRFTNFVEIMAPVLSIDMLARVFPTLAGNISGYASARSRSSTTRRSSTRGRSAGRTTCSASRRGWRRRTRTGSPRPAPSSRRRPISTSSSAACCKAATPSASARPRRRSTPC
jgi:hypothetical protein